MFKILKMIGLEVRLVVYKIVNYLAVTYCYCRYYPLLLLLLPTAAAFYQRSLSPTDHL